MCECSCLYLLVVILSLEIIDHFMVLLLLLAVLKGCGDEIFFSVPPVLEDKDAGLSKHGFSPVDAKMAK